MQAQTSPMLIIGSVLDPGCYPWNIQEFQYVQILTLARLSALQKQELSDIGLSFQRNLAYIVDLYSFRASNTRARAELHNLGWAKVRLEDIVIDASITEEPMATTQPPAISVEDKPLISPSEAKSHVDGDAIVRLIEPFTMSWVLVKIADGAIAWVGSKIMDRLFGGGSKSAGTLSQESIQQIAAAFQQILEAQRLQDAKTRLDAIQTNILEYNNSPTTSLDRLAFATNQSLDSVTELATFKWAGLPSYLLAATVRLTVLQERYTAFGDNGELLNILSHIESAFDATAGAEKDGRVTLDLAFPLPVIRVHIPRFPVSYYYYDHGRSIWGGYSEEQAMTARSIAKGAFTFQELDPVWKSYTQTRDAWNTVKFATRRKGEDAGLTLPPLQ
ncbi:hypothetical protein A1O1_03503 [Capronia coronata CBS 617.96]|uniref:Uncharacterized protein n=1 Tax=Capronia coronata CBS 617.96 TaxID=1182541 RepID=W9YC25_9EURO|nr:uncharacterized protein A1O1_03503 [Capronia coronata CBS 617.96]EXJ90402.1 hypothetical protein A1O1_03503 [Capronia coronata CBS 617.96]